MRELPNTIYMDFPFDDLPLYFRYVEPKSNRHPAFFNTCLFTLARQLIVGAARRNN